jgi:hypothetical protein
LSRYMQSEDKSVIEKLMEEERHHIVHLIKLRKKFSG